MKDVVDERADFWAQQLPELDRRAEVVVGRMQQLLQELARSKRATAEAHGLRDWRYRTLRELRERAPSFTAAPGELGRALGVSPPGMTKRIDVLEREGLVQRRHDRDDRRRVVVSLTDAGREAWERSATVQGRHEARLLAALEPAEQEQLAELLRRLLAAAADCSP